MFIDTRKYYCDACGKEIVVSNYIFDGERIIIGQGEGDNRGDDLCEACTTSYRSWKERRRVGPKIYRQICG